MGKNKPKTRPEPALPEGVEDAEPIEGAYADGTGKRIYWRGDTYHREGG